MAKTLAASNRLKLLRSDQYLEFKLEYEASASSHYIVGIYDINEQEFVLSEECVVDNTKSGKALITFSDVSMLDEGPYEVYSLNVSDDVHEDSYDFIGKSIDTVEKELTVNILGKIGPSIIEVETDTVPTSIVRLDNTAIRDTSDEALWKKIIHTNLDFNRFKEVMDQVLFFADPATSSDAKVNNLPRKLRNRLPFAGVEEYSLLKLVTYTYMRNTLQIDDAKGYFGNGQMLPYYKAVIDDVDEIMDDVLEKTFEPTAPPIVFAADVVSEGTFANSTSQLGSGTRREPDFSKEKNYTYNRLLRIPCIELLWSYWMEQGMLVQTMNTVSLRFQNVKGIREIEPLGRFDTSPLRALSHILWGYIQDEQHTVPLSRRINEYDHEYGLKLLGRAVPGMRPVDTRSKFLEAFHNLLAKCAIFYKEIDDTTRKPDGFPIYTSLKELHLLLAEGNHNAYQNLTWTVRQEMMVQQYILARQEMREFLGGRPMMPYQEKWMDKVDTMKMLQGWDSTSIIHYYDLAYCGEKLLLGIRYGNWNNVGIGATEASNWAVAFRNLAQKYIHGYQTVSGVDLSADAAVGASSDTRAMQPSLLIAGRSSAVKQTIELRQRSKLGRY